MPNLIDFYNILMIKYLHFQEEDSIITLSTGNKRKRDFDPNERGPPGSCGGGGNSSFSQIDTAGAKFIF